MKTKLCKGFETKHNVALNLWDTQISVRDSTDTVSITSPIQKKLLVVITYIDLVLGMIDSNLWWYHMAISEWPETNY